jgi:hypothetical protein
MVATWQRRSAVVMLALVATGCRAPASGGMLRPELWGAGWSEVQGTSGDAGFVMHSRPRVGPVARTYFFFIDRRCRLVPGTVHVEPWLTRKPSPDLDAAARARFEARFRRYAAPSETLEISRWQTSESGGYAVLPAGTWWVTARHSMQQSPFAAAREREWDVDTHTYLHAKADRDVALVFERIVPPREGRRGNGHHGATYRRSMRLSRRCFAGDHMTPRFTVEERWVARCATTNAEDAAQATACEAM